MNMQKMGKAAGNVLVAGGQGEISEGKAEKAV